MSNQNFAELLKSARKKTGISQKELAMQIGIFQPTISRYERDVIPVNDNLIAICMALGLDVDIAIAAVTVSIRQNAERRKQREHVQAKKHPGFCYCSRGKFSSVAALLRVCSARRKDGEHRCQKCEVLNTYGKDKKALMECNITIMETK